MDITVVHTNQYSELARRIEQQITQNYSAIEHYENQKAKRNGRYAFIESTGRIPDSEFNL